MKSIILSFFLFFSSITMGEKDIYDANLTDDDFTKKNNYQDDQHNQNVYKGICDELKTTSHVSCDDQKINNTLPFTNIEYGKDVQEILDTARTMLGLFMGMFGFMGFKSSGSAATEEKNPKAKKRFNYCALIPAGAEGVAYLFQQESQKNIEQSSKNQQALDSFKSNDKYKDSKKANPSGEIRQKKILEKLERVFVARRTSIIIQTIGWSAAAACFASTMFNATMWWKGGLGALISAVLVIFYQNKWQLSVKAVAAIKRLIAEKTGKDDGDFWAKGICNPITDPNCYCTKDYNKEKDDYPKYCLPKDYVNRYKPGIVANSCIDKIMNDDPACNCLRTNSCYDVKVKEFNKSLGPGMAQIKGVMSKFGDLARGTHNPSDFQTNTQAAIRSAFGALSNHPPSNVPNLSAAQRKKANILRNQGVPADWADSVASIPGIENVSADALKNGFPLLDRSKLPGGTKNSNYRSRYAAGGLNSDHGRSGGDSHLVYFTNPKSGRHNYNDSSHGISGFDFLKKFKKHKGHSRPHGEVIRFADRSQFYNQVDNHRSYSIFEIISKRYRLVFWER